MAVTAGIKAWDAMRRRRLARERDEASDRKEGQMKRIYDDPNHPHYGPVRRLWKVLALIYGFDLDGVDRHWARGGEVPIGYWDEAMSSYLVLGFKEPKVHKLILSIIFRGDPT